jgi:hypothetical protein
MDGSDRQPSHAAKKGEKPSAPGLAPCGLGRRAQLCLAETRHGRNWIGGRRSGRQTRGMAAAPGTQMTGVRQVMIQASPAAGHARAGHGRGISSLAPPELDRRLWQVLPAQSGAAPRSRQRRCRGHGQRRRALHSGFHGPAPPNPQHMRPPNRLRRGPAPQRFRNETPAACAMIAAQVPRYRRAGMVCVGRRVA